MVQGDERLVKTQLSRPKARGRAMLEQGAISGSLAELTRVGEGGEVRTSALYCGVTGLASATSGGGRQREGRSGHAATACVPPLHATRHAILQGTHLLLEAREKKGLLNWLGLPTDASYWCAVGLGRGLVAVGCASAGSLSASPPVLSVRLRAAPSAHQSPTPALCPAAARWPTLFNLRGRAVPVTELLVYMAYSAGEAFIGWVAPSDTCACLHGTAALHAGPHVS